MKLRPKTLLDNDFQKLAILYVIWKEGLHEKEVTYKFHNRGNHKFKKPFLNRLNEEINSFSNLRFSHSELDYIKKCWKFENEFIEYLKTYELNPKNVIASINNNDLKLYIHGEWGKTTFWEVILMAIISELYFENSFKNWKDELSEYRNKTKEKCLKLFEGGGKLMEFGTRRRRSYRSQEEALLGCIDANKEYPGFLLGCSNMFLAQKYNLKPKGTMGHELFMGFSHFYGIDKANVAVAKSWKKAFPIYKLFLPDTYTTNKAFEDLSAYYGQYYNTMRQDSGDPKEFVNKVVTFYKDKCKVDFHDRSIVFSDNINSVEKAIDFKEYSKSKGIRGDTFGIGTFITNDFEESPAMNMVIKLDLVEGDKVYKLSDDPQKSTK